MLGTIVNTSTIVIGSVLGSVLHERFRPEWQRVMFTSMGLASLALGFNAVCQNMPHSHYPLCFIVSLSLGGLVGTMLQIDSRFQSLVESIKRRTGQNSEKSARLAEGLATGILLFCIGTLSILGPINAALLGDHTYLFTNATLDLVTSAVLASTYGLGMVLAAPVLFCWQGAIYLLAMACGNVIPPDLLTEISILGGILIVASGLNILQVCKIKTLDLLPSLLMPVAFFLIKSFF